MNYALDGIVVALYFAAILWIGLTRGAKEQTLEGYALGGRSIPWWAILASILAAEISAATFLGAPGEGYATRNFQYAQLAIGTILGRLVVSSLFLKPYYEFRVVSIYEYLEARFGVATKNAASGIFLITRALASGTRLYVAAIILVLGWEMIAEVKPTRDQEIWINIVALLVLVGLTALYTVAGGIKAVVWTDVIQACVLISAIGSAIFILLHRIPGGWAGAHAMLNQPGDLTIYSTGIDWTKSFSENLKSILETEYTLFAAFLGSTFITMATHGTDQDMVQRMLTGKSAKEGKLAVVVSGLMDLPVVMAFLFTGVLMWCYYQTAVKPECKDAHVFAYFILHEMPPILRGLLIAGLLATAMGSLSTALNALATSFCRDFYQPYLRPQASDREQLHAARISTVVFALILVLIGAATALVVLYQPKARILPIVLGIFGYTYGSLLGIFLTGMLTRKRGNDLGNLIAMLCGFVVVALFSGLANTVATALGHPTAFKWDWMPVIEFPWRVLFGTVTTMAVAMLFPTSPERVTEAERLRQKAMAVTAAE